MGVEWEEGIKISNEGEAEWGIEKEGGRKAMEMSKQRLLSSLMIFQGSSNFLSAQTSLLPSRKTHLEQDGCENSKQLCVRLNGAFDKSGHADAFTIIPENPLVHSSMGSNRRELIDAPQNSWRCYIELNQTVAKLAFLSPAPLFTTAPLLRRSAVIVF